VRDYSPIEVADDGLGHRLRRLLPSDHPRKLARPLNTTAFVGTNPTSELITSGLPVVKTQSRETRPRHARMDFHLTFQHTQTSIYYEVSVCSNLTLFRARSTCSC
jgi:hypothetical protein